MNSDEVLAELDAQYQELIQSVQLEGLSQDEFSEQSGQKQIEVLHQPSFQNVGEIIRKYEQTLQTSREFYEGEIKKLESTKKKTEAKYIESKKQIKAFENRISQISEHHATQISTITEQKDSEIRELNEKLSDTMDELNTLKGKHAKCEDLLSLNQKCLEKLQQENTDLTTKRDSLFKEIEELKIKCDEQKEIISQKKMSVEKYKVEIIETRQSMDELNKEFQDIQQQLKEARDEINFLCTTNEELCKNNEKLTQKLEKYQPANSLLNSVILGDDKSEISAIHPNNIKQNQSSLSPAKEVHENKHDANQEEEEQKVDDKDIQNMQNGLKDKDKDIISERSASDGDMSVFNMDNENIVNKLDCPKLKTASSMFMIESNPAQDSKIKEEMQRLENDRNIWNNQYQTIVKEKEQLLQQIDEYQKTINDLQSKIVAQQLNQNEGQHSNPKPSPQSSVDLRIINELQKECDLLQEQKSDFEARIEAYSELTQASEAEINRLNEEINVLRIDNNKYQHQIENLKNNNMQQMPSSVHEEKLKEINEMTQKLKARDTKISELNLALNILEKENEDSHSKLENMINEYRNKSQESEITLSRLQDRYENLIEDYRKLQQQHHDTKMRYTDFNSTEQEYKTKIQQIELNHKFTSQELKQCKTELETMRKHNGKQTEELTSLNHDLKQLYRDLENSRMQTMQSQHLIQSLEKQKLSQQQIINQTQNQLQMQLQLNMQHVQALNNLKNTVTANPSKPVNVNNSRSISPVPIMNKTVSPVPVINNTLTNNASKPPTTFMPMFIPQSISRPLQQLPTMHNKENKKDTDSNVSPYNSIGPRRGNYQNSKQNLNLNRDEVKIKSNGQIMNKEQERLMSLARGRPLLTNQASTDEASKSSQIGRLLQHRSRLESDLFKLPTNPRSLEQRKKKKYLEDMLSDIESKIDQIKRL